jgi:uncharacterized protein (TIGR01777 family)
VRRGALRILVLGATGSIGRRLLPLAAERGHRIVAVSRRPREAARLLPAGVAIVAGDCACPGAWQEAIEGVDAVVHLAGAGVADERWSRRRRALIASSRIESTHQVVEAIAAAARRPRVFVCASGTGFYGDLSEEAADERFPPGRGFLADVCVAWEEQARRASSLGVRCVQARIGIVLDEEGPFLAELLPWFRLGLGATLGDGRQWVPWIHHDDCAAALLRCVERASLTGPVNLVAPTPARQRELVDRIARAVGRSRLFRVPLLFARIAKGRLADEGFRSQRVLPAALLADGFEFVAPTLDACFERLARD